MKKSFVILGAMLFLCGCETNSGSLSDIYLDSSTYEVQEMPVETQEVTDPNAAYVEKGDEARLSHKFAIKAKGADFITYEYRDIRVDELAFMAVDYCQKQGAKSAYLQDIVLHKNHNRIATFDCKNLAKEQ